jgi:hypothetical protein
MMKNGKMKTDNDRRNYLNLLANMVSRFIIDESRQYLPEKGENTEQETRRSAHLNFPSLQTQFSCSQPPPCEHA